MAKEVDNSPLYVRIEYWERTKEGLVASDKDENWTECRVVPHGPYTWAESVFTREEEQKIPKLLRLLEHAFAAGKRAARKEIRNSLGLE